MTERCGLARRTGSVRWMLAAGRPTECATGCPLLMSTRFSLILLASCGSEPPLDLPRSLAITSMYLAASPARLKTQYLEWRRIEADGFGSQLPIAWCG